MEALHSHALLALLSLAIGTEAAFSRYDVKLVAQDQWSEVQTIGGKR